MAARRPTSTAADFNPRPPYGGRRARDNNWPHHTINFNPRPPYGGRPDFRPSRSNMESFQSTPSIRRATGSMLINLLRIGYFNPRPPYGGRRHRLTHRAPYQNFNPRPPYGGRRQRMQQEATAERISIHALHTEGDSRWPRAAPQGYISIHALHTEGDMPCPTASFAHHEFQSTPSIRRATAAMAQETAAA